MTLVLETKMTGGLLLQTRERPGEYTAGLNTSQTDWSLVNDHPLAHEKNSSKLVHAASSLAAYDKVSA